MSVGRLAVPFLIALATLIAIVAVAISNPVGADAESTIDRAVDADGKIHVPENYRVAYQFLGTWAVAKEAGAGSEELHTVYASPEVVTEYRKNAKFPDGAVLVKEVYRAETEEMTTGTVSHPNGLRGWFVMVRDSAGRYGESDAWGDGWGWAWFDAKDPSHPSRTLPMKDGIPRPTFDYRENCKDCHSPAEGSEWIFTQGYPVLWR